MGRALCLAAALATGCDSGGPRPDQVVVFEGMCDASAAVALDADTFLVADDEDNVLRTYHAGRGGQALAAVDLSKALGLEPKGKRKIRWPELDLEAGTRIGERAYWLTSHGRNSNAKLAPERLRLFSTTVPSLPGVDGPELTLVGRAYAHLLDDLLADPRYAPFGLAAAAERAPKDEDGLNLEGMTATPEGSILLGFRNPLSDGLALLFEVDAPAALFQGKVRATLSDPILLDLDGLGVRALSWWHGAYLIVAGPPDGDGRSRLHRWDGRGAPRPLDVALGGFNPEGTFTPESSDRIMLLSDDGGLEIDGVPCKELKDPGQRQFRGLWIRPPAP